MKSRSAVVAALATVLSFGVTMSAPTGAAVAQEEHGSEEGHVDHPGKVTPDDAAKFGMAAILDRSGWTATASSAQGGVLAASSAIDGDVNTHWHSNWGARLPHSITIDTGEMQELSALRYLPRQTGNKNGNIGEFTIELSANGSKWDQVASGKWADDREMKSMAFATTSARYVRLTALSEAGGRGSFASAAEISLLGTRVDSIYQSREQWTVSATSVQRGRDAAGAIDGDPKTHWHSLWWPKREKLPHSFIIDTKSLTTFRALAYLPRQDGNKNGTINEYTIETSTNRRNWEEVASGNWADNKKLKVAEFEPVSTRFVRLTALTTYGDRDTASAAELDLVPVVGPDTLETLDKDGWTATGPAQRAETAATKVLDGNVASRWISPRNLDITKSDEQLEIDMKVPRTFMGLRYTPRTDGSRNGRIGDYEVYVTNRGPKPSDPNRDRKWTKVAEGTWEDTMSNKYAMFDEITSARFVKLVVRSEAGGGSTQAVAAEVDMIAPYVTGPPVPGAGEWSDPIGVPLIAAASAMLPNGKVLLWSGYAPLNYQPVGKGVTQFAIYDPATGFVSAREVRETGHDMFCPGVAFLADGRLFVTGGSNSTKASIYDFKTDTWSAASEFNLGRGYHSMTTLADGRVLAIGGSWSGTRNVDKGAEIYDPQTNEWTLLPDISNLELGTDEGSPNDYFRKDNHMWLHQLSGGRVLKSGPSKKMHWLDVDGQGSSTFAGNRGTDDDAMNGNAVIYDIDKILTVGGAEKYSRVDASNRAFTIDASGSEAVVTETGSMQHARAFHNSIVLPTGQVVTVGGQEYPLPFSDNKSHLAAEMWDPATGEWTLLNSMVIPRAYHSSAVLMPDGRIMVAGGGFGDYLVTASNHPDAEIFTPPYLLNDDGTLRDRPAITSAPAETSVGSTITIETDGPIDSVSFVRMSESTHAVNNSQRRVPVTPKSVGNNTYELSLPTDAGVLLPGAYMLFAMEANGTPSKAATVIVTL